ncbi:glycosyltransferase [Thiospirillum jenense]|uniref:Glycosyltransferase n=1 Tax=Thiospirillum jenense TaxID=1653858 RepID=A0A839HE80_9GAMM|nr:glycosyltransferase [Thiospirillum jenense]MBB1126941.1 glycosyltransferase [Thiospirillum jenense]
MLPIAELLWLLIPWSAAFIFIGRLHTCPPLIKASMILDSTIQRTIKKVSVIIPARNEQQRLPPLLASLQIQDYKSYEVIVVDDHSTDATAELARAAGAVTVMIEELPNDWLGKPYACWQGAQYATGDLLIFLDADTALVPNGLRRLVTTYQQYGGLVSVQPYHQMVNLYERLSSFFFIIMMASVRSFTLLGERIKPNGSFGPCIICDRELYLRVGGHQLVRQEIVDDIALARQFNQHGIATHNFIGDGVIAFRMYPHGISDLANGWTKNLAQGVLTTDLIMFLLTTAWISGSITTLDAIRGWMITGWSQWVIAGLIAYIAYVGQLWWLLRRLGNYGVTTALFYPASLVFFISIFIRSLYRTFVRRQVSWKGRNISIPRSSAKHF